MFSGETLWVTNAGVLATGTDPSFGGTLCRVHVPGGGAPTYYGDIAAGARPERRSRQRSLVAPAALKPLYSVAEMRAAARRVLPRPVFDFADGGAEDERTLRRNERPSTMSRCCRVR